MTAQVAIAHRPRPRERHRVTPATSAMSLGRDPASENDAAGETGRGIDETGERLVRWLRTLTVTQGRHTGTPFTVLPWQSRFIRGAFAPGIDQAGLSVGRGGGKTTLLAGVGLATVMEDAPLHHPRGECLVVASSLDQARLLIDHVVAFGGDALQDKKRFRVLNSHQKAWIENRATGARLRAIGSDYKRAHGPAPYLTLADEPAQWAGGGDAMMAALKTSRGKIEGSKFIALGTRARSPLHWFSRMLDAPPRSTAYMQSHHATDLDKWQDREQWHLANPGLDHLPDLLTIIESEASEAADDPGLLAAFKSLRLNGGISEVDNRDLLVTPELWRALLDQPDAPPEGPPSWGVDLGGAAAMSCIAACWPNGRLEVVGMFGSDPPLDKHAMQDGAQDLYELAHAHGELLISGKRIPDIAHLFREAEGRFGGRPAKIVTDRWRVDELKDSLDDASWQTVPLVTRGQGYRDGGEDIRAWRSATVARKVSPVRPSILLSGALSEAATMMDPAGNEKLCVNAEGGRRKRARDDAAAAAILAVAHMPERQTKPSGVKVWGAI